MMRTTHARESLITHIRDGASGGLSPQGESSCRIWISLGHIANLNISPLDDAECKPTGPTFRESWKSELRHQGHRHHRLNALSQRSRHTLLPAISSIVAHYLLRNTSRRALDDRVQAW
jgi:hypothetical protein